MRGRTCILVLHPCFGGEAAVDVAEVSGMDKEVSPPAQFSTSATSIKPVATRQPYETRVPMYVFPV